MRIKEHHRHLHARTPAADSACSSRSASTTAQQAAAAWAWFEHGGSSCITPSKAEGLAAANGSATPHKSVGAARPSRFKKEVLISTAAKIAPPADDHHVLFTKLGRAASRRRHSFDHHHDLADLTSSLHDQRFSSSFSCRSASFHFDDDGAVNDQDVADSAWKNEARPLLDKFEVEAVCKQLHDRFSPSRRSPCSSAESQEYPLHHHLHPEDHPKSHASTHKPSADNDHHHSINNVVRRLLHMHMKVSSGHSTPATRAPPLFCSSIATANSIIDQHHHHHPRSPKNSKGKVLNYSGELRLDRVNSMAQKVLAVHGDDSSVEDGALALTHSNRHRQLQGDHVRHIHHHHHHHYHHLQQTKSEAFTAQGTAARHLLRNHHVKGNAELQASKIYRLYKESKLAISGVADHQEAAHLQNHENAAAPDRRQQTAAKLKAEKYLWPAARIRAAARTDHVDLQALGAFPPTF